MASHWKRMESPTTSMQECNENANPAGSRQSIVAGPSPSIAERAKCFGSVRTSNSSSKKKESPSKNNSQPGLLNADLAPTEVEYPMNIVAIRRTLFSQATINAHPNANPRSFKSSSPRREGLEVPTLDKENNGDDKGHRRSDVQAPRLSNANKRHSLTDDATEKAKVPVKEHTESTIDGHGPELKAKGFVEKRMLWLQGKVSPSSNATEFTQDETPRPEEPAVNASFVAARTSLLQRSLNTTATSKVTQVIAPGVSRSHTRETKTSVESTKVGFDAQLRLHKQSPSFPPIACEAEQIPIETLKTGKPKTLVGTRTRWLEKQVFKNNMCHDTPSDDEEEEEEAEKKQLEKPKTDIQIRLEALQKEMMASQQHGVSGVAPRRCLSDLP